MLDQLISEARRRRLAALEAVRVRRDKQDNSGRVARIEQSAPNICITATPSSFPRLVTAEETLAAVQGGVVVDSSLFARAHERRRNAIAAVRAQRDSHCASERNETSNAVILDAHRAHTAIFLRHPSSSPAPAQLGIAA